MPDPATGAIVGTTLIAGHMGAKGAEDAAEIQADAALQAALLEKEMYDISRKDLAPYREQGYTALKDIEAIKPFLTSQFGPDQFEQYLDPSMEFRRRLGEQSTARMANVGGGALSGNTLRALTDYGQGLASTEYGSAFDRFQTERGNIYNTLANIAGMGQNAVNTGVSAGQTYAGQRTALTTGAGAAQAAGVVGAANAYGGAAQNIGNMAYMQSLMRPPAVTPTAGPSTTMGQASQVPVSSFA